MAVRTSQRRSRAAQLPPAPAAHECLFTWDSSPFPLALRIRPLVELSDQQLLELCSLNPDLRIERNAEGELLIMPPAGSGSSRRNVEITTQLQLWSKRDGTGVVFDSSGGFTLPNSAMRAPDASWVLRSRWEQIPEDEQEKFAPICPDVVIELRSPSDTVRALRAKLDEYLANGARLGWLIDPQSRCVYVYRPGVEVERLENPDTISGDPVLPGFVLDLREVW